jgi:hypothetical protein
MIDSFEISKDLVRFFKLIKTRNKLVATRSSTRFKLFRIKKILTKKKAKSMRVSRNYLNVPVSKVEDKVKKYSEKYNNSCKKLAEFTSKNRKFRQKIRKEFNTKQANDASNNVIGVKLVLNGVSTFFSYKEIDSIITDIEINNILVG